MIYVYLFVFEYTANFIQCNNRRNALHLKRHSFIRITCLFTIQILIKTLEISSVNSLFFLHRLNKGIINYGKRNYLQFNDVLFSDFAFPFYSFRSLMRTNTNKIFEEKKTYMNMGTKFWNPPLTEWPIQWVYGLSHLLVHLAGIVDMMKR